MNIEPQAEFKEGANVVDTKIWTQNCGLHDRAQTRAELDAVLSIPASWQQNHEPKSA